MSGPPCAHTNAVPVDSAGETVAALCPDCDRQLPAAWLDCDHAETVDVTSLASPRTERLCLRCGVTYTPDATEGIAR